MLNSIDEWLRMLFLSDMYARAVDDKTIADTDLYPLPDGSYLLQDMGFLGFDLGVVEIIMSAWEPKEKNSPLSRRISTGRFPASVHALSMW